VHSTAAIDLFSLALSKGADEVSVENGNLDREEIRRVRPRNFLIAGRGVPSNLGYVPTANLALFQSGCVGDGRSGLTAKGQIPLARDLVETFVFGRVLALSGAAAALPLAERLENEAFPVEAEYLRGLYEVTAHHPELALEHCERALIALRSEALPLCEVANQLLDSCVAIAKRGPESATRFARVLMAQPFAGYLVESNRIIAAQQLAFLSPAPGLCVEALGKDLLTPTWTMQFLGARLECLERARHPMAKTAAQQFAECLANTSGDYGFAMEKPQPDNLAESPPLPQ
jgi:hypothetical protein